MEYNLNYEWFVFIFTCFNGTKDCMGFLRIWMAKGLVILVRIWIKVGLISCERLSWDQSRRIERRLVMEWFSADNDLRMSSGEVWELDSKVCLFDLGRFGEAGEDDDVAGKSSMWRSNSSLGVGRLFVRESSMSGTSVQVTFDGFLEMFAVFGAEGNSLLTGDVVTAHRYDKDAEITRRIR